MGTEIERKFIVINDSWKEHVTSSTRITQGYMSITPTVRVRLMEPSNTANMTIKSRRINLRNKEFEYDIPYEDAKELLELCVGCLTKVRHTVPGPDGLTWEIDEFTAVEGKPAFALAEIEIPSEDYVLENLPSWIGDDVSYNPRYLNSNMVAGV